jgi:Ca2+-binding RTX toxin-like protein
MAGSVVGTVAVALAIGLTTTAHAQRHINGTPGDDRIRGARGADLIHALAGDDRIGSRRGPDTVMAGPGLDRIWGGPGADRLFGGAGNDRIWSMRGPDMSYGEDGDDVMGGGPGNDRQWGGTGNDLIYAARGADESWGEEGNDTLWAMARRDVHVPNDRAGDVLHGGPGNDTFRTRDGEADVVDCGAGVDTAYLDHKDVLATPAECEVVNRARHRRGQDRRESAEPKEDVGARD